MLPLKTHAQMCVPVHLLATAIDRQEPHSHWFGPCGLPGPTCFNFHRFLSEKRSNISVRNQLGPDQGECLRSTQTGMTGWTGCARSPARSQVKEHHS